MPSRRGLQSFTFGRHEGVHDLLDAVSDYSSSTDECDSNDSGSLDLGSVTYEGKDEAASGSIETDKNGNEDDEWAEDEYPPLHLNEDALMHMASLSVPGNHGKCVGIIMVPRDFYHEIRALRFEDGWSCIGRFLRDREESPARLESEYANRDYVRKRMSIPVPETFLVDPDPNNAVGAAFVIEERIETTRLTQIWHDLSLEHKTAIITQVADVVLQLASLKFDRIGSLEADGSIGPLNYCHGGNGTSGPFTTTEAYLSGNAPELSRCSDEVKALNNEFKSLLSSALGRNKDNATLNAPYRLSRTSYDALNMLFTQHDPAQPPKLVAAVGWDNARTGLFYELMEYPTFIQDIDWSPEQFESNKILRKHFVRCLANGYPRGSKARAEVKECFRSKEWVLSNFRDSWVLPEAGEERVRAAKVELERLKDGTTFPYEGTVKWEPDSEVECEDEAEM